jgi:lycopene beta-cyclase
VRFTAGTVDVAVAGAGPAAWATAAACADAGLSVALVAPEPHQPWRQVFGAWIDDVPSMVPWRHRWDEVRVVGTREHTVARAYGLIDNDALASALRRDSVAVVEGRVVGFGHQSLGSAVMLSDGRIVEARLAVDATGAGTTTTVHRARAAMRRDPAWQSAYGVAARFERPPVPSGTCTLMDWSGPYGTFLYAMDLGDGTTFVEETELAARPMRGVDQLAALLDERLGGAVAGAQVQWTETVQIPMDLPVPAAGRAAAMGAAAAMVHPATGYSVARSLRAAPVLAAAVADALRVRRVSTPELAAVAWRAVWPSPWRRSHRMYASGLRAVMAMDPPERRRFFDAFFELPVDLWAPFMRGEQTPGQVAACAWELFRSAPTDVRRRLTVAVRPPGRRCGTA